MRVKQLFHPPKMEHQESPKGKASASGARQGVIYA